MTVRRTAPHGSSSAVSDPPPTPASGRSVARALHVNQRTLQAALGVIWIIDGLLKFQPSLLKPSFISDVIRPMAVGQPSLVAFDDHPHRQRAFTRRNVVGRPLRTDRDRHRCGSALPSAP